MTKVQQKKEVRNIPYDKYYIDSAKFFIDASFFTSIDIPENFTILDSDTGEEIDNFKKYSLSIPYKNHKITIANITKNLKQGCIKKILIYFPAKVRCNEYFYGIDKQTVIDVLDHIRSVGYLKFDDTNYIYKQIYIKDLDIKLDMKLSIEDKINLKIFNTNLKQMFNGSEENFHSFDSKKQGFGISTYKRETASISKPFLKFYDKSFELKSIKNKDFFDLFNEALKDQVRNNFIYRYEFTLKDKTYFDKFGISNKLEDIHEVIQDKWKEIGKAMLDINFQVKVRKPKDTSKLTPTEKILALNILTLKEFGMNLTEQKNIYISPQTDKKSRHRASLLFDRIYYFATVGHAKEIQDTYEMINHWYRKFGFFD